MVLFKTTRNMISDDSTLFPNSPSIDVDLNSISLVSNNTQVVGRNGSTDDIIIDQYANNVTDYSSQYGGDNRISYTAFNLTGRPSKFPDYGDFPETYAMRQYGHWWDEVPSKVTEIMPQSIDPLTPQDYIVLHFEQYVLPRQLTIFETYNPGAVIGIWAYTLEEKWMKLWSGVPNSNIEKKSRAFMPPLGRISSPTRMIKLEFYHSHLEYFTELDAVKLSGVLVSLSKCEELVNLYKTKPKPGVLLQKLERVSFTPLPIQNQEHYLQNIISNDILNFLKTTEDEFKTESQLKLHDMPVEILLKIFGYLDLRSLYRVSQVNKKLYDVATHSLLYTEINLRPYWHIVNPGLLSSLNERCKLLKKIDFSWISNCNIMADQFIKFIRECGRNLTHLRLNSCKFLTTACMATVGTNCLNLRELSLRNFPFDNVLKQNCLLNFKNLERLDLLRSRIEIDLLLQVLKNNPNLKHLNISFQSHLVNMDMVAMQLAICNKHIVSIDMWKSHSLSSAGLYALSNCSELEEVDFGWCLREEANPGDGLRAFLNGCPKLRKLFLTAIRGLTDRDLDSIANFCPNLEQLDLMGVMGISNEKCHSILNKCKNLKLLDLSFCDHLDDLQISLWRDVFNVQIKRATS